MGYRENKGAALFIQQFMDYEKYVEEADLDTLRFWKEEAIEQHYRLLTAGSEEREAWLDLIIEIENSLDTWQEAFITGDNTLHRKVWYK